MTAVKDRSVLLLATNKQEYLQFALNCADSVRLHNPDLPVFIATNVKADNPKLQTGIKFIEVPEEIAQLYIEAKLHIDKFLQTEETLFIDSDCLCYGGLTPVFEACNGMDVTVVGRVIPLEQQWGTSGAAFARKEFGINESILFNGGFYYIKKNAVATRIYDQARAISVKYDEYGFNRIKNKWKNEEDLLAITMIANKQRPIADDGQFMTDLFTELRPKVLNVLKGERLLQNPAYPSPRHRSWYPSYYSPVILHFGGSNIRSYPYIAQSLLLKLRRNGVPAILSSIITFIFIHIPYKSYHWLRSLTGKFKDN
jgi:hypothetical protein